MSQNAPESSLESALTRLRADREGMPWPERRALARAVAEELRRGRNLTVALPLLHLLADDPKWEVCQDAAAALVFVPDDDLASLAPRLASHPNAFVRRATETALTRRRTTLREDRKRRRGTEMVDSLYEDLKRGFGDVAALKALELADRRSDLLARAAVHDLRSILTPLKASADRLAGEHTLSPGTHAVAQRLAADVEFLERYVGDLSAYSRSLPVERTQERLAEVVHSAVMMAQENLRKDGCDPAAVGLCPDVPDDITCEIARELMVLALGNVLKNAYQSVSAKVALGASNATIEVCARTQGEEVVLFVRDTGLGLSPDDLQALRKFEPGRKNKAKKHSTGFGLPTAERYVRASGGRLDLDGRENEGVTVTITLPVKKPAEE